MSLTENTNLDYKKQKINKENKSKFWLWVSWKDIKNPAAGGAELVHQELSKRLVGDGHRVVHLVPGFKNSQSFETIDGVEIHRVGNNILFFYALPFVFLWKYFRKADVLIDVFNCFASYSLFFARFNPRIRRIFLIHHIQDKMWFYQTSFHGLPDWFVRVINFGGFFSEKIQLASIPLLLAAETITVSESAKDELTKYFFNPQKIGIIREGCKQKILPKSEWPKSQDSPFTVCLLGLRKSKRPEQTLLAFSEFQKKVKNTKLVIAGWGTEAEKLKKLSNKLGLDHKIEFLGRVSDDERDAVLQQSHVLCTTPVKEGWGIIVIEANQMATPVIGYDVPGLCDALAFDNGILTAENPTAMANALVALHQMFTEDYSSYLALQERCVASTLGLTFDNSYQDFLKVAGS